MADVVFLNGPIETVTGPTVEAVAVRDGRIVAVGSAADALATRTTSTEVIDLAGRALLPGLIEPHTHPDLAAQMYAWVDVSGFTHSHVSGVEAALRSADEAAPAGQWIFAFGLDPILTSDVGAWDRHRLDALVPDRPVAVMVQSMHTLYVNSRAIEAAGLTDDTPDPGQGGHYGRDAAGHLTGRVEEQAAMLPFVIHGLPTPEAVDSMIAEQLDRYAAVGITTLGMAGSFGGDEPLRRLASSGASPVRVVSYLRHEAALATGPLPRHDADDPSRFRIAGAKLWYDGSPYTGTMLLDEPYLETDLCCCTLGIERGTRGRANFEPGEVAEMLSTLHADGWQVLTHAQGDRACREIVDLYAGVVGDDRSHRWRVEHCALFGRDDLHRAAAIGASPSFHVDHVRYYGPELAADLIGPERAAGLMPIRSAIDAGHRVSLHADSPMYPPGPLRLAATAVTRRTRLGTTIADDQAITAEQALRAVTIDAAWQLGLDREVGSIEVGKRADFTIVDRSPLRVDASDIDGIHVESTWVDGALA
ncbi:MAG: amidohydrolase [Ilumatobacter fluminis]|uniref:amidohydrolase n=1 Tax=Ilumatobacter fluminis TaxID=467091 RepID=UPI0032F06E8A